MSHTSPGEGSQTVTSGPDEGEDTAIQVPNPEELPPLALVDALPVELALPLELVDALPVELTLPLELAAELEFELEPLELDAEVEAAVAVAVVVAVPPPALAHAATHATPVATKHRTRAVIRTEHYPKRVGLTAAAADRPGGHTADRGNLGFGIETVWHDRPQPM
jgi:hypothetical protein